MQGTDIQNKCSWLYFSLWSANEFMFYNLFNCGCIDKTQVTSAKIKCSLNYNRQRHQTYAIKKPKQYKIAPEIY